MSKSYARIFCRLHRLGLSVLLGISITIGLLMTMTSIPNSVQASSPQDQTADVTVVVNPGDISHQFKGAGVQLFDSDYQHQAFTDTLEALGIKYIRIQYGPFWDSEKITRTQAITTTPVCNDVSFVQDYPEMYDFVSDDFNGDFDTRLANAISISTIAQNLGIETIFLNWRAPKVWHISGTQELDAEYVNDYACFVTANVDFLTDQGVEIDYLEPTNEPSIAISDTKIPPALYNTFVISLKKYLDKQELSDVKLLGPGLAYFNHDNTGITWTHALTPDGVAALSGWASHAWDPEFFTETREADIIGTRSTEFVSEVKQLDPDKPIFITEYACVNDPGNGVCAVENTLTLLNHGANSVIYWYLKHQAWDLDTKNHKRALLTGTVEVQPTYQALSSVLPHITGDEVNVLKTQVDGQITAASFHAVNDALGEAQVTVVMVNSFSETKTVSVDIVDLGKGENGIASSYYSATMKLESDYVPCQSTDDLTRCNLTLQPQTIMTFIFPERSIYIPVNTWPFDNE